MRRLAVLISPHLTIIVFFSIHYLTCIVPFPPFYSSFLQNPYFFMYASLVAPDSDEELHLLRDKKTRSTTGSTVSSLYHLKDIDNSDAGFFVFPDLSVRMEGTYRLKLSLFEIIKYVTINK